MESYNRDNVKGTKEYAEINGNILQLTISKDQNMIYNSKTKLHKNRRFTTRHKLTIYDRLNLPKNKRN